MLNHLSKKIAKYTQNNFNMQRKEPLFHIYMAIFFFTNALFPLLKHIPITSAPESALEIFSSQIIGSTFPEFASGIQPFAPKNLRYCAGWVSRRSIKVTFSHISFIRDFLFVRFPYWRKFQKTFEGIVIESPN